MPYAALCPLTCPVSFIPLNPCPEPQNAESAYLRLALDGDTTMMRCLRDLGVAWDPARASEAFTVMCGYHCDLAVLTWLLGPGGCPVD